MAGAKPTVVPSGNRKRSGVWRARPGKRQITRLTTDADGDSITALESAARTIYDEDDDPTSTRYTVISTVRTSDDGDGTGAGGRTSTGEFTTLPDTRTATRTTDTATRSTRTRSPTDTSTRRTSTDTDTSTDTSTPVTTRTRNPTDTVTSTHVPTTTMRGSPPLSTASHSVPSSSSSRSTPEATAPSSSTNNIQSSGTPTGKIVGGVVGGVVGALVLLAILILACLFFRRRQRKNSAAAISRDHGTHSDGYYDPGPAPYSGPPRQEYAAEPQYDYGTQYAQEPNYDMQQVDEGPFQDAPTDLQGYEPGAAGVGAAGAAGAAGATGATAYTHGDHGAGTGTMERSGSRRTFEDAPASPMDPTYADGHRRRGSVRRPAPREHSHGPPDGAMVAAPSSRTRMADAADEVVGSRPAVSGHKPAPLRDQTGVGATPSPPRRAPAREEPMQFHDAPQQSPDVFNFLDGWTGEHGPYAAAGVGHRYEDDHPPPVAFHMRPGQVLPRGQGPYDMSPVGAFTQQNSGATEGTRRARQHASSGRTS